MSDNAMEIGAQLAALLGDKDQGADLRWAVLASSYPIAEVSVATTDAAPDGVLTIRFANGAALILKDTARSCCESRYMSCDDDLAGLAGGYLRGLVIEAGPDADDEWGECHQQMFLKVRTTQGDFTVVTHNVHSGYYGGFDVTTEWREP